MPKSNTKPEIIEVPLSKLRPAPWNYKLSATPEQREKLKRSIEKDRSAGVIAVRHLGKGIYEVIDGNHRLEALQELEWETATVENFGKVSTADAALISRRRNTIWFESNDVIFGQLLVDEVLKEYSLEDIAPFMEEELGDLQALVDIHNTDFRWPGSEGEPTVTKPGDQLRDLTFTVSETDYQTFKEYERGMIDKLGLFDIDKEATRRGAILMYLMKVKP